MRIEDSIRAADCRCASLTSLVVKAALVLLGLLGLHHAYGDVVPVQSPLYAGAEQADARSPHVGRGSSEGRPVIDNHACLAAVLVGRSEADPHSAATMASLQPSEGRIQDDAVARRWCQKDPDAAKERVGIFPSESLRSAVTIALGYKTPVEDECQQYQLAHGRDSWRPLIVSI